MAVVVVAASACGCVRGVAGVTEVTFTRPPDAVALSAKIRTVIGIPAKPPEGMTQRDANRIIEGVLYGLPVDFIVSPEELGSDEKEYGAQMSRIVADESLPGPYALLVGQITVREFGGDVSYASDDLNGQFVAIPEDRPMLNFGWKVRLRKQDPELAGYASADVAIFHKAKLEPYFQQTSAGLPFRIRYNLGDKGEPVLQNSDELMEGGLWNNDTVIAVNLTAVKNSYQFRRMCSKIAMDPGRQATFRVRRGPAAEQTGGWGVVVSTIGGKVLLFPFPDGPAVPAGVRPGDRLVRVNDLTVSPKTFDAAVKAMNDSSVATLVVERAGSGERSTLRYSPGPVKPTFLDVVINREAEEAGGLGVRTWEEDGKIAMEPLPGRPAQKAGIRKGDILAEIDRVPVAGSSLASVSRLLRGGPKQAVELAVVRGDSTVPLRITVVHDDVPVPAPNFTGRVEAVLEDMRFFRGLVAGREDSATKSEEPAEADYAAALGLYNAGDHDGALARARAATAAYPNDWKAWQLTGNCLYAKGDTEGALAAFKKCLELNPNNPALAAWVKQLEPKEKP